MCAAEISTNADCKCQSKLQQRHHHHQQPCHNLRFLALSAKRHVDCYERNGKSYNGSIWWQFGRLLAAAQLLLLFATQAATAQNADIVYQPMNINNMPAHVGGDVVVPLSGEMVNDNLIAPNKGQRQYVSFSDIDKEVVERLIRQWAPVVWLAPEEKFMPLGVEEFLAHVHPESKDKSFTPGVSFGDNSEKSYLVTNAEIDQLLENENSFIYGRNPNVSPTVPIYAVVTLCDAEHHTVEQKPLPPVRMENVLKSTISNVQQLPQQVNYPAPPIIPQNGFAQSSHEVTKATRGPYIPITLDPQDEVNNTVRRSSRLFPLFQRVKRNVNPILAKAQNQPLPQIPIAPFDLVMGESAPSSDFNVPQVALEQPTAIPMELDANDNEHVNNFIANLVDNVKFSIPINEQENFLANENRFSHQAGVAYKEGAPVPSFHVTYWMFYPYSQGKNMCTLSLGPFGRIPFPAVYGYCLGRKKDIGSHIGDWEHMTLYFTGSTEPEAMYVSAHDAGAFYTYNHLTGSFEYKRQETRKGILQRPNFPKTVTTFNDHPVLFAAKGSHGLWTAPGKHRFVKVARLYDINGFGTPWNTWKSVSITYENLRAYGRSLAPTWFSFKGKWGNPKSKCHPLRRIGLNFCEFADGPTGIPLKEPHFQCGSTYRRR